MQTSEESLKARLQSAMKIALKAADKKKLGVIRLMLAAIKQKEIDGRLELDDPGVIVVLDKMVKQRRDSASQFRAAGRTDLADTEDYEIEVIQAYLPQALAQEEILSMIKVAVESCGANSAKDMGKVMGILKPMMQGRAELSVVSREVAAILNKP